MREKNQLVDLLLKACALGKKLEILLDMRNIEEGESMPIHNEELPSWVDTIKRYMGTRELKGPKDMRRFKSKVAWYLLIGGELFRRSTTTLKLRCVKEIEKDRILTKVHLNECICHLGEKMLTHQILR